MNVGGSLIPYETEAAIPQKEWKALIRDALRTGTISTDAAEGLQAQRWALLRSQTRKFTLDDSSTLSEEQAERLLESIDHCIDVRVRQEADSRQAMDLLLRTPLRALHAAGQELLQEKIGEAERLLARARVLLPPALTQAYRDTLDGLGLFFKEHDRYLFTHEMPCSVDYPLFRPAPELPGVEGFCAYVSGLLMEARLLRCYPASEVEPLYRTFGADWQMLWINLYEPVLCNALARSLIGLSDRRLDLREEQREQVAERLARAGEAAQDLLREAAGRLLDGLDIREPAARAYALEAAESLRPYPGVPDIRSAWAANFRTPDSLPAVPDIRFEDGRKWTAGTLRLLVRAVDDAETLSEKVDLVRLHVRSLADLADVLEACFYQDDPLAVFPLLGDAELAKMLWMRRERRDSTTLEAKGDPSWGPALQRYVDRLPPERWQAMEALFKEMDRQRS